ncbi:MAG TPA: DUF4389 domain-containing protein [Ignavibacteriaceae bacterium]|nr:DUF4389 domain-containing protein [Ignavibacteriaceae bacterium]
MGNSFNYPVRIEIDYPEKLDKLSSIFRIFYAIPVLIVLSLLAEYLFPAVGLMILFRQKYPKWWFDWNLAYYRFSTRVSAYLLLLRDEYPSTDEEQAVHIEMDYPDAKNDLKRGMPLVKWFLAIPHYLILCFLYIAVTICSIAAWFIIIFTSKYPKGMFDFVVGVMRWSLRVNGYAFLLITDKYPPFSTLP